MLKISRQLPDNGQAEDDLRELVLSMLKTALGEAEDICGKEPFFININIGVTGANLVLSKMTPKDKDAEL